MYPKMLEGANLIDFSYVKKDNIPFSAVLIGAVEVAFVGVLETLISAKIADNMTSGPKFDARKEVFGLSIANLLSGFLGGAPCTGVLVRTAVNVSSGANDKISQFINAVVLGIVVLLLLPVFTYIPMPVIASILITSSIRLIPFKVMEQLISVDFADFLILLFTTSVCIFVDGAIGLIAGSFVCLLRSAVKFSD
jgi:SulP family sulfate permease